MADFNVPPGQTLDTSQVEMPPAPPPQPQPQPQSPTDLETNATPPPPGIDPGAMQAANDFRAASAGGWKFSPTKMDALIKELEGHLGEYLEGINPSVEKTSQVNAPGDENASAQLANSNNASAGRFQAFHKGSTSYLKSYIDTLNQIKSAYTHQDSAALDAVRKLGIEKSA